jgi:hypothetical protein
MVISSNLNLIPYPVDNYQLKPLSQPNLFPRQELGREAVEQYNRFRYPGFHKYSLHAESRNTTYGPRRSIESIKIDQVGLLIDIYV